MLGNTENQVSESSGAGWRIGRQLGLSWEGGSEPESAHWKDCSPHLRGSQKAWDWETTALRAKGQIKQKKTNKQTRKPLYSHQRNMPKAAPYRKNREGGKVERKEEESWPGWPPISTCSVVLF